MVDTADSKSASHWESRFESGSGHFSKRDIIMRKLHKRYSYIFRLKWPPPPPREFKALNKIDTHDGWCAEAIRLYGIIYNMTAEYTSAEYKNIQLRFAELYAVTPTAYKIGFHVIGEGQAYLGEDIMMVDGRLTHQHHCHCPYCNKSYVVSRDKSLFPGHLSTLWCVKCDRMIPREKVIRWR